MNDDFASKLLEALEQMEKQTISDFIARMIVLRALKGEAKVALASLRQAG